MVIGNSAKENEVKNLIIRAWRERWTDCQWGIHIRPVNYNLLSLFIFDFIILNSDSK